MRSEDEQTRALYELCALVFTLLRSPPGSSAQPARTLSVTGSEAATRGNQVTPAAFASLLLGASMALMLSGSLTFVIGFMLMPWVLGLVMVLYFVGIVSSLSGLGRAVLCPGSSSSGSSRNSKEMPGHFFSKVI